MDDKKIKRTSTPSIKATKDSPLVKIITNDKQLAEDKPRLQLFLTFARMFDDDLYDNLYKNSFELDNKYSTYNANGWVEFKQHTPVRRYIDKFIQELQYAEAAKTISNVGITKATDAMAIQNTIDGKREQDKNTNVIIFLIPQRNYKKVD